MLGLAQVRGSVQEETFSLILIHVGKTMLSSPSHYICGLWKSILFIELSMFFFCSNYPLQ